MSHPQSTTSSDQLRTIIQQTLEAKSLTQTALAKQINYNQSSISAWLKGKYPSGAGKIEHALWIWLRKAGLAPDNSTASYIPTEASSTVFDACVQAQEQGFVVAIIGAPGTGKTMGLREWERWARAESVRYISVTANITSSAIGIIRKIAEALELGDRGAANVLVERIVDKLNRDPSVILIDEAQHLGVRALEAVRSIHDQTWTGVVFCGSLTLARTLVAGDGNLELRQLQDRIELLERLEPLTAGEVSRFVERHLGELPNGEVLAELRRLSGRVPRRLVRLLSHCRRSMEANQSPLTVDLVRGAATRLVGLDPEEVI